ncbi:MAG: arabinogalactan endo-beta-1,4-galactanase [Acutalibacteraceae bacterium]
MKLRLIAAFTTICIALIMTTGCISDKPINSSSADESDNKTAAALVEPVDGLSSDFIKGMDISSIISLEKSGVVYYDYDGKPQDIFLTLSESGVNYIRVRVWNDPFDSNGYGYGGGNCDAANAAEIGKRAAACGMKLLVDFHYSDFWADPDRQNAPKAWADMSFEDKKNAIYDYTAESLKFISESGADIGMVQIGNEINGGMAGEYQSEQIIELLKQASRAVRDVSKQSGKDIKTAVHYTDIENYDAIMYHVDMLKSVGLDYDIFGVSYYPYWHGSMENMKKTLRDISQASGKSTMILETSYPYTTEDGDGFKNVIGDAEPVQGYKASVQGQSECLRDIIAAASEAGAIGVCWWEGAWIPVNRDNASNSTLWEKYGSGWASSYSAEYDPDNAGKYYGGSSWDNQAMFDFDGHPLDSLNVFNLVG